MWILKSIEIIDMEINELKKHAWAPTPLTGMQLTKAVQHQKMHSPEIKNKE